MGGGKNEKTEGGRKRVGREVEGKKKRKRRRRIREEERTNRKVAVIDKTRVFF